MQSQQLDWSFHFLWRPRYTWNTQNIAIWLLPCWTLCTFVRFAAQSNLAPEILIFSSITIEITELAHTAYEIVGRGFKWPCLWSGLRSPDNVCKRTGLRVRTWRRLFLLRTPSGTDCGNAVRRRGLCRLLTGFDEFWAGESGDWWVGSVWWVWRVVLGHFQLDTFGYLKHPQALNSAMRSMRSFSHVSPFLIP